MHDAQFGNLTCYSLAANGNYKVDLNVEAEASGGEEEEEEDDIDWEEG